MGSSRYLDLVNEKVVVYDGAFGTYVQTLGLGPEDFGGGFVTIQQVSSGRFLEATLDGDFNVVTRQPGSDQQTWRVGASSTRSPKSRVPDSCSQRSWAA